MQAAGEHNRIFDRLTRPLTEIGSHRMGGISEQRDSTRAPFIDRLKIIDLVTQDRCVLGGVDDVRDRLMPTRELSPEGMSWVRIDFAEGAAKICKPIHALRIESNRTKAAASAPGFECITYGKDGDRECGDPSITRPT